MKYSIIIPSYKNTKLMKMCLEAIKKNTQGDFEVIVIDDNSGSETVSYLKSAKGISLVLNKENKGFAWNNNKGASLAKGEILIFLNNDTEVQPGWLEAIDDVFNTEENVGAVGVKLLYPDGTIQHAGVVISTDHMPRYMYKQKPADFPPANIQREYKEVTAACIAIPKKIFEEVGGFDEAFRTGFEDIDLCLKLVHKGYRIIYTPKSVVIHHESVAPGRFISENKNFVLYMSRWKDEPSDAHKYYREDGHGTLWILWQDLYTMSWGKDRFGTRPTWIKFARILFIPLNKIATIIKLVFSGDWAGIKAKAGRYSNEG
jgi:GT2 family glycosyltransferase